MPITDLTVMFTGDTVPDGFSKVSTVAAGLPLERSPSGLRADLNKGARGVFVYLCQSKDQSSNKLPISEIIAIYPERGEFVPTDYEVVQRRGLPANLNTVRFEKEQTRWSERFILMLLYLQSSLSH
uniref:MABP domain-containing protein n=1 Tax=Globisporangium ultimum (strain ATCC 200006 / CBS 805.95 / DAOM BR144) TaxID=431595 RepID=K3WHI2_GLOUD